MPSRPWPFWLLTVWLIVGFPTVSWIYWPQVLDSGVLDPNADSVIIPMVESIIVAVLAAPFLLFVAWLCLRRYNSKARWLAWRTDRLVRSLTATSLAIVLASSVLYLVLADVADDWPWYEYLWPAYFLFWIPWALGLRAAVIEQLSVMRVQS